MKEAPLKIQEILNFLAYITIELYGVNGKWRSENLLQGQLVEKT